MEDIYLNYLYDCYIANKRLTGSDWEFFGRETHHVEVPERDGGFLTSLNSQDLTTYQHWVAGILQSEVLGKCCFAMVPSGTFKGRLEELRVKWHSIHGKEVLPDHTGKVWVNNGCKETFVLPGEVPVGWTRGRLPSVVEEMNKRSRVQLVGKTTKGTKWYTNPEQTENRRLMPGTEPEGWTPGRVNRL